jgi:hypothetical protein
MKKINPPRKVIKEFNYKDLAALPIGSSPSILSNKSLMPILVQREYEGAHASRELLVRATRAGILLKDILANIPSSQDITAVDVKEISDSLWDQVGVRFFLLDLFYHNRFSSLFQEPKHPNYRGIVIRSLLEGCSRILSSFIQPDRFMLECSVYRPEIDPLLILMFRDRELHVNYHVKFVETVSLSSGRVLSESQTDAIRKIRRSIRAHRRGFSVKGLRPRSHLFLVGMSGVGKSFCVQEATKYEALPCFSSSLPAWIVLGARGTPTLYPLQHWLHQNPQGGVIHIDEIDKINIDRNDGNSSWFSAVRNEIIRLIDKDVTGFPGFDSKEILLSLSNCLFVASGTFQDLFRSQISHDAFLNYSSAEGDSASIVQELKSLVSVDVDDIRLGKYLPEELINRFSHSIVHIMSPSITEFSQYLSEIDASFQIFRSDHAILEQATLLFASGVGFRGLEDYIQECLQNQE